ncbi:MAG TPA: hypothetical protein VG206_02765 [Terriglobia bacterium]|nr:hypothetical protein [Terriglobia bacterium]
MSKKERSRAYYLAHREELKAKRDAESGRISRKTLVEWYQAAREEERVRAAAYQAAKLAREADAGLFILEVFDMPSTAS